MQYREGFDAFAFIDCAVADGFDGVALSANDDNYRHLGGKERRRHKAIADYIAKNGLLCDIDTSSTEPQHLSTMLHVAQDVGARKLRTYTQYQGALQDIIAQTIADLRAIAPLAADMGIVVMLENHETFTGEDIATILGAVDSPWVRALYDYGNSQMVLEHPLDALSHMLPLSASAHIKDHVCLRAQDSPLACDSVLGVPIGEGYLDIAAITQQLIEGGCHHLVFENSHGYLAPIREERKTSEGLAQLGEGMFGFARAPFDPKSILLDSNKPPIDQLLDLEKAMHQRSLSYFRNEVLWPLQNPVQDT